LEDKKDTYIAAFKAFLIVAVLWNIYLTGLAFDLHLTQYGLSPRNIEAVWSIFTFPFLHSGFQHLFSNSIPLFLLSFGLFLFYKEKAWKILFYLYLSSSTLTWIIGRPGTIHVGASGVVYALAAFLFVSGIIKKENRQMAFALLVAFLYGGFVWALFPELYKDTDISWEGHLSGLFFGVVFAFVFRKEGLQRKILLDEDEEDDNILDENSDDMDLDNKKN
jgi:membrane associated rhomboid family serine protease